MNIDTSRLLNLGNSTEKPMSREAASPQLQRIADTNKHNNNRADEVYKSYQENSARAGALMGDILNGVQSNEDPYSLLLKATEALGLVTSNTVFHTTVKKNILRVNGEVLQQPQPLKLCIEQEQEYLARLKKAKETAVTSEEKRLYQSRIEAAEQKIKRLTGQYMDENRSQRSDI